jgi:plasmid stability protein
MQSRYNAGVTTITIRNVPEEVRNSLAAKARGSGQSMQEYTLAALARIAAQPDQREVLAQLRARQRAYPPISRADLLADLSEDRR